MDATGPIIPRVSIRIT